LGWRKRRRWQSHFGEPFTSLTDLASIGSFVSGVTIAVALAFPALRE
jgi:hypothetical protein